MGILSWALVGLVAGALAKLIMPGKQGGGILITMALGVVGGLLGGFIASALGIGAVSGFNLGSLVIAIAGSLLVLFIYGFVKSKK